MGVSLSPSDEFFAFYETAEAGTTTPNLKRSLDLFRGIEVIEPVLSSFREPQCLIQGYSCSSNAKALHDFLAEYGIENPQISVIDIDERGFIAARERGLEKYIKEFIAGNASDGHFIRGSMDILVQDHLFNCACFEYHESIIESASRVLKDNGIAMISYTSCDGIENTASDSAEFCH
ncbi:MAG: methyltransferase domain-containing protein [Candidatus Aenigmarchaeota archaeon]|nr:methyltransferase domain-containing protein [Candidatus Aenigmarchaeota archaeon]